MYGTMGGVNLGVKPFSSHMLLHSGDREDYTPSSTAHWQLIMPLMISEIFDWLSLQWHHKVKISQGCEHKQAVLSLRGAASPVPHAVPYKPRAEAGYEPRVAPSEYDTCWLIRDNHRGNL